MKIEKNLTKSDSPDCFEEFVKSIACEREVDDEIYAVKCEKSGIQKTYWGKPSKKRLAEICKSECQIYKRAAATAAVVTALAGLPEGGKRK